MNWYNPNQLMVQVANQINAAYSNPINKVVAVMNWIGTNMIDLGIDNMHYNYTSRELFQALEGVCGNYSDLTGTLLKMIGFVSRQVVGNDWPRANATSSDTGADAELLNHQWLQVWIPEYQEWITMDPLWQLWEYDNQVGGLQNYINTNRSNMQIDGLMWPTSGTNPYYDTYGTYTYKTYNYDDYFSYFKGCEWQALNNLGRFFDVPAGSNISDYDFGYADALTWLLNWSANPNNSLNSYTAGTASTDGISYNFESMGMTQN